MKGRRMVHRKRARASKRLLKRDCTCRKLIVSPGPPPPRKTTTRRPPTTTTAKKTTPATAARTTKKQPATTAQRTTAKQPTTTTKGTTRGQGAGGTTTTEDPNGGFQTLATKKTTTAAPLPRTTNQGTKGILDEIGGDLNPNESRLLIHARTKVLGLVKRIKIEVTKSKAMLDMDGSLFGTFLKASFGIHVAFKRPRSFRCFGAMSMESKEEVLNKVKAKLKETADKANAKFAAAKRNLDKVKKSTVDNISRKQRDVDAKRKIFNDKAATLRSKKADLQSKRSKLTKAQNNLNRVCKLKNCGSIKKRNVRKRIACGISNGLCKIARGAVSLALGVAKAALWVAEGAVEVAATVVEKAQVVLDVKIGLLQLAKNAAKGLIWVAQKAVDAAKALVGFGLKLAEKIIKGLLNAFYLRKFEFDFMMSKESKYLKVYLDATVFGLDIKIDFTLDFSSFGAAIRSFVKSIVGVIKKAMGFKKRRGRRDQADDRTAEAIEAALDVPSSDWYGQVHRYAEGEASKGNFDGEFMRDAPPKRTAPRAKGRRGADQGQPAAGQAPPPAAFPAVAETVCSGACECKVCMRSAKDLYRKLHAGLVSAKAASAGVQRAAQAADRDSSVERQEFELVEAIDVFRAEELARRAEQKAGFATAAEECAGDDDVAECIAVTELYDAKLASMTAGSALVNELAQETSAGFEARREVATDLHRLADEDERAGWRDSVGAFLFAETEYGTGCPEVECAGLMDCVTSTTDYVMDTLESLTDAGACPGGFESEDGGCDESERLLQAAFIPLRSRWATLA